ncbi:hypothetical protein RRG08_013401 [Elysia crispata]|uniref:Uncharacterized protein n=1 Tax=Elysia crispata TaxID=231223 RepID=A0AAE1B7C2_9GAST|nr:hypothetical protein RRG08_013401 [Elysia crispata]
MDETVTETPTPMDETITKTLTPMNETVTKISTPMDETVTKTPTPIFETVTKLSGSLDKTVTKITTIQVDKQRSLHEVKESYTGDHIKTTDRLNPKCDETVAKTSDQPTGDRSAEHPTFLKDGERKPVDDGVAEDLRCGDNAGTKVALIVLDTMVSETNSRRDSHVAGELGNVGLGDKTVEKENEGFNHSIGEKSKVGCDSDAREREKTGFFNRRGKKKNERFLDMIRVMTQSVLQRIGMAVSRTTIKRDDAGSSRKTERRESFTCRNDVHFAEGLDSCKNVSGREGGTSRPLFTRDSGERLDSQEENVRSSQSNSSLCEEFRYTITWTQCVETGRNQENWESFELCSIAGEGTRVAISSHTSQILDRDLFYEAGGSEAGEINQEELMKLSLEENITKGGKPVTVFNAKLHLSAYPGNQISRTGNWPESGSSSGGDGERAAENTSENRRQEKSIYSTNIDKQDKSQTQSYMSSQGGRSRDTRRRERSSGSRRGPVDEGDRESDRGFQDDLQNESDTYASSDRYSFEDEVSTPFTPGNLSAAEAELDHMEKGDRGSLHEDNAFGYQFRSYLSGSPLINAFLTLWQLLLLVISGALLAAAVGVKYYFSYMVISQVKALPMFSTYSEYMVTADENTFNIQFSGYPNTIGTLLIISHGLYLVSHLLYVTYGIHKIQLTLPVAALTTAFVAFAEISIINVVFNPNLITDENIVQELRKKLYTYSVKSNKTFDMSYDYMAVFLRCCGITDEYDFFKTVNLGYDQIQRGGTKTYYKVQIAPTCCRRDVFAKGVTGVDNCAKYSKDQYIEGCFTLLVRYIASGCKYYAIVVWIHLVDTSFHASLYKKKVAMLAQVLEYKTGTDGRFAPLALTHTGSGPHWFWPTLVLTHIGSDPH